MNIMKALKKTIFLTKKKILARSHNAPIVSSTVDFDISMGKGSYYYHACMQAKNDTYTLSSYPYPAADLLNFFKSLYEKNNLEKIKESTNYKIPAITHQIWAGAAFPAQYHAWRESWIAHHPDWTHVFWTDNPINYKFGHVINDITDLADKLAAGAYAGKCIAVDLRKLQLHNQQYYDQATNFGEKTDILKYELVHAFGGVYIDIDFECFKPFDILHRTYDFYVGIQPLDETLALGAALFAADRAHPILTHCIETIKDDRNKKNIIERTGPVHFTRSFWHAAQTCAGATIAFPATFFYPVGLRNKSLVRDQMLALLKPESFALHHWAGSWVSVKMLWSICKKGAMLFRIKSD